MTPKPLVNSATDFFALEDDEPLLRVVVVVAGLGCSAVCAGAEGAGAGGVGEGGGCGAGGLGCGFGGS